MRVDFFLFPFTKRALAFVGLATLLLCFIDVPDRKDLGDESRDARLAEGSLIVSDEELLAVFALKLHVVYFFAT